MNGCKMPNAIRIAWQIALERERPRPQRYARQKRACQISRLTASSGWLALRAALRLASTTPLATITFMKSLQLRAAFRIPSSIPTRFARWSIVSIIAWCVALIVSAGAADAPKDLKSLAEPKRVVIPHVHGPITVDGDLSEPAWAKAAVLSPFFQNDGSGRERENTVVRLWYDETALYLGWTITDADIQATFTARDSKFWEEEVAEFFITAGGLDRYFELQWNPLGGVFDAIISNKIDARGASTNFVGDWNYTAKGMKSAVKLKGTAGNSDDKDEMWQVEVMIPFADLNEAAPKPGAVWRGNFYRFNRAKGQRAELLSWSPTLLPGFHQPSRFGYLEFGK
jgi:hypothetical protein